MNCQVFLLSILVVFNVAWEISADGETEWRNAIKPYADECRYHMSEEIAAIFDDDEEACDNEQVRDYLACVFTSVSYMVDGAMNPKAIDNDIDHFFADDPSTASTLHNIVNFCVQHEVNPNDAPRDVAGKFTNCLNSHKKTDVEA